MEEYVSLFLIFSAIVTPFLSTACAQLQEPRLRDDLDRIPGRRTNSQASVCLQHPYVATSDFANNHSVKPNSPPAKPFTIPTVRFPSGDYVMESKAIATRLEKDYPSPSLHLDSLVLKEVEELLPKFMMPLRALCVPAVPSLLNERSVEYFERTRAEALGKTLQEYAKTDGGEKAWIEALPGLNSLGELIKKEGGPYVMGKTGKCCWQV